MANQRKNKSISVPFVSLQRLHAPLAASMRKALDEILKDSSFILGPDVARFEEAFAKFTGAAFAVGVASGTDALHLSLRAAGIGPGDEVIVPAMTFAATSLAVLYSGAWPVLADVQKSDALIDLQAAEAVVTPRTKAIIPVHLYGRPCDMQAVMDFAQRHHLAVIEDACQAHGATFRGKSAGTFGQMGCFSFYPAKNLGACGDGGMVVTNDAALRDKLHRLRNYGQRVKYKHDELGFNSRLDTLQASFLLLKLKGLRRANELRRRHAARYAKLLKDTPLTLPEPTPKDIEHVYHLYVARTSRRDELMAYLHAHGVDTGIHYPFPLNRLEFMQPYVQNPDAFPNADRLAREIVSFPMFPELKTHEVDYVAQQVQLFFKGTQVAEG